LKGSRQILLKKLRGTDSFFTSFQTDRTGIHHNDRDEYISKTR
jgi:hypothetical protein